MSTDDISQYLDSLEREHNYRVDSVLKKSAVETTERVFYRMADDSEHGPYIRKRMARDAGIGAAYERIYEANRAGRHFEHLPFVHEHYRTNQDIVVVLEHVNGLTLGDAVYESDPGVALACRLFPALCDAVSELHESFDPPLIHRDLKPSNIVLRNNIPVIIDFGIAREYDESADADTTQFGTRAYAPPEQFGYGQTTIRSDIYALGMLLYFLLTEQTPSPKTAQGGFAEAAIPPDLRAVLARATAFDPQQRYESARALKAAFMGTESYRAQQGGAFRMEKTQAGRPDIAPEPAPAATPEPGAGAVFPYSPAAAAGARGSGIPPYSTPSSGMPAAPASRPPSKRKGFARNVAVLVVCLFFLLVTWQLGFDPSKRAVEYPEAFAWFAYLFFMPALIGLVGYALLDKGGLKLRHPSVHWISGTGTMRLLIIGIVALLVLFGVVGTATGAL